MRATREELPILFGTDAAGIRGADWGGVRTAIVAIPAGTGREMPSDGPRRQWPRTSW